MDQGYATQGYATATAAGTRRRPLRRDAERNRLLILSSARTVFAQRGLDASLDEVAREAGLGVGTVYRRFPNRDALIDALFVDGIATIGRIVDEALGMPRAWDGLRHFMSSMLELQCQDKGLRDVMLARRAPETTEELMRNRIKPPMAELVRRAKQEGDLRKDLTDTDIAVLEIGCLGSAEFTALADRNVWRRYLTIMMDGMRARPEGADGNSPLEHPPLDDEQIDACMVGWKYGTREAPRQRQKPTI
jgi:AcrR family transcriptional regulator